VLQIACFSSIKLLAVLASFNSVIALHFNCDYSSSGFAEINEEKSLICDLKNTFITTPSVVIEGLQVKRSNNEAIRALTASNQTVNFFPIGIENVFKNLRGISIWNCSLRIITKTNLQPFPKLKGLWLPFNKLEVIESELFLHNKELSYVNFYANNLKHIASKVLLTLNRLTYANFYGNECTSLWSAKGQIEKLKSSLSCQNNEAAQSHKVEAEIINEGTHEPLIKQLRNEFQSSLELVKIDCVKKVLELEQKVSQLQAQSDKQREQLAKLEQATIDNEKALEENAKYNKLLIDALFVKAHEKPLKLLQVDLQCDANDQNKCNAVDWFLFDSEIEIRNVYNESGKKVDAKDFKELSVVHQDAFHLPSSFVKTFPKLEKLSITNSRLLTLENVKLCDFKLLQVLDLKHNQLRHIAKQAFSNLLQLVELDLSFNKIQYIEDDSFRDLPKLRNLNLNSNAFIEIKVKLYAELPSLKQLHLRNNRLEVIKTSLLNNLRELTIFDLSGNICIDMKYQTIESSFDELKRKIIEDCVPPFELCCELEVTHDSDENSGLVCR